MLIQMDARSIPYTDEFDVVGAFDVLEHVEQDAEALSAMYRACRTGGGILITVPQHKFLWSAVDEYAPALGTPTLDPYATGVTRNERYAQVSLIAVS